MRLFEYRSLRTQNAGKQARNGVHDDHRRELPAGQHVVADRKLVVHEMLADSLVDSFIASAQQDQVFQAAVLRGYFLPEQPTLRAQQYDPRFWSA
jgi:hypothetical protein